MESKLRSCCRLSCCPRTGYAGAFPTTPRSTSCAALLGSTSLPVVHPLAPVWFGLLGCGSRTLTRAQPAGLVNSRKQHAYVEQLWTQADDVGRMSREHICICIWLLSTRLLAWRLVRAALLPLLLRWLSFKTDANLMASPTTMMMMILSACCKLPAGSGDISGTTYAVFQQASICNRRLAFACRVRRLLNICARPSVDQLAPTGRVRAP